MLAVVHRRFPDAATTIVVGAGWHAPLDIERAPVEGAAAPSIRALFARRRDRYASRLRG